MRPIIPARGRMVPSEQRGGEVAAGALHPRVVVADGAEEADQVGPGGVAVALRRTPDQVDQPVEGVLDVPAEEVEVGHQRLGVDVVGARRPRRRGPR